MHEAGDKLMPDIFVRQFAFMHSTCRPFDNNKERI